MKKSYTVELVYCKCLVSNFVSNKEVYAIVRKNRI